MKFCGEITYDNHKGGVHSDICWNCDTKGQPMDPDYRKFLHDCLDEWINKSKGTGAFWLGDPKYFETWGE
jgi:hypothetical protein